MELEEKKDIAENDVIKKKRGRPKLDVIKEQHQYPSKDKTYISKYNKERYEKIKPKLLAYMKQRIECPLCKTMVGRVNLGVHQKREKCKKLAEKLKDSNFIVK